MTELVNCVITQFIKPASTDHTERCRLSLEYLLTAPESAVDIPSLDESEFQAWLYQTYGPLTVKKVYEFKDLPDPSLIDVLKYQFPETSEAKLQNFLRKMSATEIIVLSIWLDRLADPICAMLKAGVHQKFKY